MLSIYNYIDGHAYILEKRKEKQISSAAFFHERSDTPNLERRELKNERIVSLHEKSDKPSLTLEKREKIIS